MDYDEMLRELTITTLPSTVVVAPQVNPLLSHIKTLVRFNNVIAIRCLKGRTEAYMLCSDTCQRAICDDMGYMNVSVGMTRAAAPHIPALLDIATPDTNFINLTKGDKFISMKSNVMRIRRTGDVVTWTVVDGAFPLVPVGVNAFVSFNDAVLDAYIARDPFCTAFKAPFTDDNDYRSMLWLMGDALLEPCNCHKFTLLYGTGRNGKSTMVNIITDCLGTSAVGTLDDRDLKGEDYTGNVSDALKRKCVSSRLIMGGEMRMADYGINLQLVKLMSGGDRLEYNGISFTPFAAMMGCSNSLMDPYTTPEYGTVAMSRRIVVLEMDKTFTDGDTAPIASDDDKVKLVSAAVYVRARYDTLPMLSVKSLLYTLAGTVGLKLSAYFVEDPDATDLDELRATTWLAVALRDTASSIACKVEQICPHNLTGKKGDEVRCIRHMRLLLTAPRVALVYGA